jgi:hypothetical protein
MFAVVTSALACLTFPVLGNDGWQAFSAGYGQYQPYDPSAPVSVDASITEQSGFGSLMRRYTTQFTIRNDGTAWHGYGVRFTRADEIYTDSAVLLFDDGDLIQRIDSPFQYGPEIHTAFTINPNGSIAGRVNDSTHDFDFAFESRPIASQGRFFGQTSDYTGHLTAPTITYHKLIVPEPTGLLLFFLILPLMRHHRR